MEPCENPQEAGTAMVFDGLLLHHGTGNISTGRRFFYYMAISTKPDPNTEVTGFAISRGRSSKAWRQQARRDRESMELKQSIVPKSDNFGGEKR